MKQLLKLLGWIGIVILELLNPGNASSSDTRRKPDDENIAIIGFLSLCIIIAVAVGTAVAIS